MRFKLVAILMFFMSALTLSSQELEWSVDMNAVFNNRESDIGEAPSQTFLFTRITPQIGVSMDSTRHRIMGGVTWYQPMNDHLHGYKVVPSLYYHYKDGYKGYEFKIGMIANEYNANVPKYLRSDSINYVRPNVTGMAVSINKIHFFLNSWLDWRQIQTQHRREAFDVHAHLGWKTQIDNGYSNTLGLDGRLYYNHLAKSKSHSEGEVVVDNIIFSPHVYYYQYFNYHTCLMLEAGMLMSCDRDRIDDNKWQTQVGFVGAIMGMWKWLSLYENIYAGKPQMPLYEKYGSLLYQGDQFYHNKFYSRTDLVATIFRNPYINLEARLTFHATDKATAFWQQVAVRFYLNRGIFNRMKHRPRGTFNCVDHDLVRQF